MASVEAFCVNVGDIIRSKEDGNYYRTLTVSTGNQTVEIVGVKSGFSGELAIPDEITDSVGKKWTVVGAIQNNKYTFSGVTSVDFSACTHFTAFHQNAFSESAITTIELPASLTTVDTGAFASCTQLKSITVASGNMLFSATGGVLYNKAGNTLLACPPAIENAENYNIASSVTTLASKSFYGCQTINTINIPTSVTTIEDGFLYYSRHVTAITVDEGNTHFVADNGVLYTTDYQELIAYPGGKKDSEYTIHENTEFIHKYAFNYNGYIHKLIMNDDITQVDASCVHQCNFLTDIVLSDKLQNFAGAFTDCSRLVNINVKETNEYYSSDDGVIYSKDWKDLIFFPTARDGAYTILDGTVNILESAFANSNIQSVTIPSSLESIGERAFRACKGLTTVTLPSDGSLRSIGARSFDQCLNLSTISIPASVTEIIGYAFNGCTNLTSVEIEDNSQLQKIYSSAFAACPKLAEFTFNGSATLQEIGSSAFDGDKSLASFSMPARVTIIGSGAFNNCSSLTTVTFADNAEIRKIGSAAFQNTGLESIHIPSKVETIERSAFTNCNKLEKVEIPASTTSINPQAFEFCSSLTEIVVDEANEEYKSIDGMLMSGDKYFTNEGRRTLVIFPAGKANKYITLLSPDITEIGEYAFYYCQQLENVTIPNQVNSIKDYAFDKCDNLKSIAFLTDHPIPAANIAATAFNPENFTPEKKRAIGLYVRNGVEDEYKTADSFWKDFGDITTSFETETGEFFPMSETGANMLGSKSSTASTLVVPATITDPRSGGKTYNIAMIGDYAFNNAPANIKEVVLQGPIQYIGARAFTSAPTGELSGTIENIFFINKEPALDLSTVRFKLTDNMKEFAPSQHIYVRRSAVDKYKEKWGTLSDQISEQVPLKNISNTFATFSREFDIDLNPDNVNWNDESDCPKVIAFTAGNYGTHTNDEGETYQWVHMESVNCGQDKSIDGTYIPANTGVLLKSTVGNTTGAGLYYCIGEEDKNAYDGENLMQAITERDKHVEAEENGNRNLYISGGKLYDVPSEGLDMKAHLSYMNVNIPAGAKIAMTFEEMTFDDEDTPVVDPETPATEPEEEETTGVAAIATSEVQTIYDLQGRNRTGKAGRLAKGIYIINGKKTVVK